MSSNLTRFVLRSVVSSLPVIVVAAVRGRIEGRSAWRPINAISHIVWGPEAGTQIRVTLRYTGLGLLLNGAACGFWTWVHGGGRGLTTTPAGRAFRGLGVSILAYVTDYHLIPRRFTPGFELSLSRRSFPWLYGALTVGLLLAERLVGRGLAQESGVSVGRL
jgi:hypothetical protein